MGPTIRDCAALDDGRLGTLAAGFSPGPDPLYDPGEYLTEVQVDRRRSRHDHRLRPPIRELPLKNGEGKFGANVDLARQGGDHPGLKIGLSLPNESLEGPVRFALPSHPVAQGLRGHPGQLRRSFSIAPAADRVEDDGGAVIGQFRLPTSATALPWELDPGQILSSDSWASLRSLRWPSDPSVSSSRSFHLASLSGRKLFSHRKITAT
jgi:hypothetical protein